SSYPQLIPLDRMPIVLRYLGRLLPLTYSVEALRSLMTESTSNILLNTVILAGYSILLLYMSIALFKKNQE
ncbi:hypothetical protein ACFL0D_01345, partial [Thermoproteota archaeon]